MEPLEHFLHNHPLILNEVDSPADMDVKCIGCKQPINKLIDSFYSCTTATSSSLSPNCLAVFMHRTCAELPKDFIHPKLKQDPLRLRDLPYKLQQFWVCYFCSSLFQGLAYCPTNSLEFIVCLKCVTSEIRSLEDRNLYHPGHSHPLTLFQKPSLFLCDACNTSFTDMSYACTKCSFTVHKSCASAPATYRCKFHNKHQLILVYSLPKEYYGFVMYCSICNKYMNSIYWLYYCANCRFFAHLKCASSKKMLSEDKNDEAGLKAFDLVQFPAADVSSLNDVMQKLIIQASSRDVSEIEAPPDQINHWAHKQHQLVWTNKISISPVDWSRKLSDEGLLICDGCTKPIYSGDGKFYECNSCNYVLHSSCAQFPNEMQHPVAGQLVAEGAEPYKYFKCRGCGHHGNGFAFSNKYQEYFHIGCVSVPNKIIHKAHHHPLYQCQQPDDFICKACLLETSNMTIMFGCESCTFYIHLGCALRPSIVNHRWDPHPLSLILSSKDITDHPHEFQCENCSDQIHPNTWFYHCSHCDQSFHMVCIDRLCPYPYYKFGATNIKSEKYPHPHGLTYLLNKKKRRCNKCGKDTRGKRVLECSPCQFIVHVTCR